MILALDLYFQLGGAPSSSKDTRVVELSDILNQLPIHKQKPDQAKFRNPNGVSMKMSNFLRLDPSYQGVGLTRGNKLEKEIWDRYSKDTTQLRKVAAQIRAIADNQELRTNIEDIEIDDSEEANEGRALLKLHKYRERNKALVKKKKASALKKYGHLGCEACGFDFEKFYGPLGKEIIECHHKTPLPEISPEQKTTLNDLALICANCHKEKTWVSGLHS